MMQAVIFAAMALAGVSATFGAVGARLVWAHDLEHAQELRRIWDKTEKAMEERILAQDRTIVSKDSAISSLEQQIATLKRRLTDQPGQ
jgi:hypothetical protein